MPRRCEFAITACPSKTTLPPTMVRSTFVLRTSSTGQVSTSRSMTIRSASLPTSMVPFVLLLVVQVGVVDRVQPQRLLAGQRARRAPGPCRAASVRVSGDPDAEPGVPGVGRVERVVAEHVVAAAADGGVLEPGPVGLEPAHARLAAGLRASVGPSLYSQAGCTSAQTPSVRQRSRLCCEGKLACVMQWRSSLIGTQPIDGLVGVEQHVHRRPRRRCGPSPATCAGPPPRRPGAAGPAR